MLTMARNVAFDGELVCKWLIDEGQTKGTASFIYIYIPKAIVLPGTHLSSRHSHVHHLLWTNR